MKFGMKMKQGLFFSTFLMDIILIVHVDVKFQSRVL